MRGAEGGGARQVHRHAPPRHGDPAAEGHQPAGRAGVTKEQIFLFGNLIFLYGECEDVEKMNAVLAADGLAAQWAEDCDNTVRGASHLCRSLDVPAAIPWCHCCGAAAAVAAADHWLLGWGSAANGFAE